MQQAREVAIAGLHCGGEELWWPLWCVAAAIAGPGVLLCCMGVCLSNPTTNPVALWQQCKVAAVLWGSLDIRRESQTVRGLRGSQLRVSVCGGMR